MPLDLSLVKDVDAVSPRVMTNVLRRSDAIASDDEVVEVSCRRVGEGMGEMCVVYRATLRYRSEASPQGSSGPRSVIIKLASTVEEQRSFAQRMDLYRREVGFYSTLAARTAARTPECYFAASDADGEYCTLILEDLTLHEPGDDVAGCTPQDARQVVDQLARLHAPLWNHPELVDLVELPPHDGAHGAGIQRAVAAGWPTMVANHGEQLGPRIVAAKDDYIRSLPDIQRWITAAPATLVHGDCRLDNLMFDRTNGPDPIVLLDWQGCLRAKGIQDVAYFISHTMNPIDRRDNDHQLLAQYRGRLAELGVTYDDEQCELDFRRAVLYMFSYAVAITGAIENSNERNGRRKVALISRVAAALTDWECLDLLPFVDDQKR